MDYLTLSQELVQELGIAGGTVATPGTVTAQTGELGNVVRWIRNAETYVNNLWKDWKFLHFDHSTTLSENSRIPPGPGGFTVREWDRNSFYLNRLSNQPRALRFIPYQDFRHTDDIGIISKSTPDRITVKPDGSLLVNKSALIDYTFTAEGWRRPAILVNDTDLPAMPAEFHRIIMVRAMIFYGNREDAPEIISGAEAEYIDILEKLQSSELEAFRYERLAGADELLSMEIPDASSPLGIEMSTPTTR